MRKEFGPLTTILLILFGLSFYVPAKGQEPPPPSETVHNISVQDVNFENFPTIEVEIAAFDRGGVPIKGLMTEDFVVTEDDDLAVVTNLSIAEVAGPLHIHFLIDAGAGLSNGAADPRWDNTITLVENFINGEMDLDQDTVSISVVDGSENPFGLSLLDPTSDPNEIINAVNGYTPPFGTISDNNSNIFTHLDSKVDELSEFGGDNQSTTIVVVSGALLNNRTVTGDAITIETVSTKARELGVPIHTVLVKDELQTQDSRFQDLGLESNGLFVHYPDTNAVGLLYQTLNLYRLRYLVQYDSISNAVLERTVQVEVPGSNRSATGTYAVDLRPPEITIVRPQAGESLLVREQTVEVERLFVDGFIRRIRSGRLLVNGIEVDDSPSLEFSWTPDANETGAPITYELEVEVEDTLGFVSTSNIVSVQVESAPVATSSEGAESGTTDAANAQVESGGAAVVPATQCYSEALGTTALCSTEAFVIDNAIALLAILSSLVTILFVSRSRSEPAKNIRETIAIAGDRITKQFSATEPLGFLEIVAGDEVSVGRKLPLLGDTSIGRSRDKAQLLFHQNVDDTPISRLHCTILDRDDGLYLRDEGSTHGTFHNRRRLTSSEPVRLSNGDEIELALVEQGGVRLKFEAINDPSQSFNAPILSAPAVEPEAKPEPNRRQNAAPVSNPRQTEVYDTGVDLNPVEPSTPVSRQDDQAYATAVDPIPPIPSAAEPQSMEEPEPFVPSKKRRAVSVDDADNDAYSRTQIDLDSSLEPAESAPFVPPVKNDSRPGTEVFDPNTPTLADIDPLAEGSPEPDPEPVKSPTPPSNPGRGTVIFEADEVEEGSAVDQDEEEKNQSRSGRAARSTQIFEDEPPKEDNPGRSTQIFDPDSED